MALPEGVFRVRGPRRDYWYYQLGRGTARAQPRVRIEGDGPHDPLFWQHLKAMGADVGEPEGTLAHLIEAYQASPHWRRLSPETRRDYDRHIETMLDRWGDDPLALITRRNILGWRREYDDRPTTANHIVSVVSALFKWGIGAGLADHNPADGIPPHKLDPRQAPPWPVWAKQLIRDHARWEVRGALELLRFTGQRTADIVKMTLHDIAGPKIPVVQQKGRKPLLIPVHPELRTTISEARARGSMVLFPRRDGDPMSADAWRSMYYRELDCVPKLAPIKAAGLSAHGHRADVTNNLLEAGCTTAEVAAITGMSLIVVERYAIARDQTRLAERAMDKWTRD